MEGRETAVLQCDHCGVEYEHTLRYAGRLLAYTRCHNCGFTWHRSEDDLREQYVRDLASRVLSKPGRWARRLHRHPVGTLVRLPISVAVQPVKFARELAAVLRG